MIHNKKRLDDLKSYRILDTSPDEQLDQITELASLICDTPISLITLLDDKRQWFKSNKGLSESQTDVTQSFCQYALGNPKEVFVVNDSWKDDRFKDNELVVKDPNIRFYAGAPLETMQGNVLGTLCIIDTKPKEITENQKKALEILARKAMGHIELRKVLIDKNETIAIGAHRLNKLTQNIPGGIFQLRVKRDYSFKFEFLSQGIKDLYPNVNIDEWLKSPSAGFSFIHPEDIENFKQNLINSVKNNTNLYYEYRVCQGDEIRWHSVKAHPEYTENGDTILYGVFNDVSHHYEYQSAMEQISFDISHKLRKPVTNLLGLTHLAENNLNASKQELKEYIGYIQMASDELDEFTKQLNKTYEWKKQKITNNSSKKSN